MTIISQTQRYIPHELNTKYYAVKLYRNGYPVSFVCRKYKISKRNDNKLVIDTLNEAISKEKDVNGLIIHSD